MIFLNFLCNVEKRESELLTGLARISSDDWIEEQLKEKVIKLRKFNINIAEKRKENLSSTISKENHGGMEIGDKLQEGRMEVDEEEVKLKSARRCLFELKREMRESKMVWDRAEPVLDKIAQSLRTQVTASKKLETLCHAHIHTFYSRGSREKQSEERVRQGDRSELLIEVVQEEEEEEEKCPMCGQILVDSDDTPITHNKNSSSNKINGVESLQSSWIRNPRKMVEEQRKIARTQLNQAIVECHGALQNILQSLLLAKEASISTSTSTSISTSTSTSTTISTSSPAVCHDGNHYDNDNLSSSSNVLGMGEDDALSVREVLASLSKKDLSSTIEDMRDEIIGNRLSDVVGEGRKSIVEISTILKNVEELCRQVEMKIERGRREETVRQQSLHRHVSHQELLVQKLKEKLEWRERDRSHRKELLDQEMSALLTAAEQISNEISYLSKKTTTRAQEKSRQTLELARVQRELLLARFWEASLGKRNAGKLFQENVDITSLRSMIFNNSLEYLNTIIEELVCDMHGAGSISQVPKRSRVRLLSSLDIEEDYGKRSSGERKRVDLVILFALFECALRSSFQARIGQPKLPPTPAPASLSLSLSLSLSFPGTFLVSRSFG